MLKYDLVLQKNVHEIHLFLAHRIDKNKMLHRVQKEQSRR